MSNKLPYFIDPLDPQLKAFLKALERPHYVYRMAMAQLTPGCSIRLHKSAVSRARNAASEIEVLFDDYFG